MDTTAEGRRRDHPVVPGTLLGGATCLLALVGLLGLGVGLLPTRAIDALDNATTLACALTCLAVARRVPGSWGRAWAAFAMMLLLWLTADVLWALSALWHVEGLVEGAADTLYLAGTAPAVAALLLLPVGAWERGATLRVALDVGVLAVPLLLVGDALVLRRFAEGDPSYGSLVGLTWPVLDVVLACLAFVLCRRRTGPLRLDLALLVLAFTLWAVADSWWALLDVTGGAYLGSPVQYLYLLCPALLALAAVASSHAATSDRRDGIARHTTRRVVALLPDLLVLGAGVTVIAVGVQTWHEWVLVVAGVALAATRQAMIATDALVLRGDLEARVVERTEELAELSARHHRILDSVGEGIVGVDRDGTIRFVNAAAAHLLGSPQADLLDRRACTVLCGTPHEECPLEVVALVGHGGRQEETTYRRSDGTALPVEITVTAVSDAAPGGAGAVVVFRDVTERQAMEQVKAQFISSVSHELRTPLTAIRGALEMLADGDGGELEPQAQSLVASAERGATRLGRLVDDIIDVEKLASGSFSVVPRPIEIGPVVYNVVESLSAWAARQDVDLRPVLLTGVALADPDRVEQALVNLIGNAVKFSPAGGTVHLAAHETEHEVVVEVRDEGRGIPPQDLANVFDRFHQVELDDGRVKGGSGLGLTITRSIVERHGGRVWVESTPGEGATFRFSLPRPVPSPEDPPASETLPLAVPAAGAPR